MTCKRRRSTSSSSSSCTRSKILKSAASANEPGAPGMVFGLARTFGPEGRNTMWKGFQKPKRLASELESLTEEVRRFSGAAF